MKLSYVFVAAFALLTLPGFAEARKFQYAPPAPATVIGSQYVVEPSIYLGGDKHPLPRNILDKSAVTYSQDFGGGGAGLGLLLGPFGVLANAKAIENATEKDVAALKEKFQIDPVAMLNAALGDDVPGATTGATTLVPSVYVNKSEKDELIFRVALNVKHMQWQGRYVVVVADRMPLVIASAGLSDETQKNLKDQIVAAFVQSIQLMEKDAAGQFNNAVEKKLYIEAISPRFKFFGLNKVVSTSEDGVVIRSGDPTTFDQSFNSIGGLLKLASKDVQEK